MKTARVRGLQTGNVGSVGTYYNVVIIIIIIIIMPRSRRSLFLDQSDGYLCQTVYIITLQQCVCVCVCVSKSDPMRAERGAIRMNDGGDDGAVDFSPGNEIKVQFSSWLAIYGRRFPTPLYKAAVRNRVA